MSDDPIRQAAHDLHNHLHALEMGLLALTAANDQEPRNKLSESLQHELRDAKEAVRRLVDEVRANQRNV